MIEYTKEIISALNKDNSIPGTVIYKPVVTGVSEITAVMEGIESRFNMCGCDYMDAYIFSYENVDFRFHSFSEINVGV